MEKDKRDFIINELMISGFIENKNQEILLEESEETGRSELKVHLRFNDNLCIANVDKKKTDIRFFKTGMLELQIPDTVMYTTFERVQFTSLDTMPSARRTGTGRTLIRMEDEWNGIHFGLNFGKRIPFMHLPIQMERNEENVLVGNLKETK